MANYDVGLNLGRWGNVVLGAAFLILVAGVLLSKPFANRGDPDFLIRTLSLTSPILLVPIALNFCHRTLVGWSGWLTNFMSCEREDPTTIFRKELDFFRGSPPMYATGLILGLVGAAAAYLSVVGPRYGSITATAATLSIIVIFVSEFFAGVALYALFRTARA